MYKKDRLDLSGVQGLRTRQLKLKPTSSNKKQCEWTNFNFFARKKKETSGINRLPKENDLSWLN